MNYDQHRAAWNAVLGMLDLVLTDNDHSAIADLYPHHTAAGDAAADILDQIYDHDALLAWREPFAENGDFDEVAAELTASGHTAATAHAATMAAVIIAAIHAKAVPDREPVQILAGVLAVHAEDPVPAGGNQS